MSKAIDKEYLLTQLKNFFKIKLNNIEIIDNKVTTIGNSPTDKEYPTAKAVKDYIDALPEPMIFKGSLGIDGTITSLPTAAASNEGFTYKVITAGTYQGVVADIGDTFISDGTTWVHIPSGDEPNGTVINVAAEGSNGIQVTGGPITDSGTFKISGIDATQSSSGMMSAADKKKLDNLSEDPSGYLLPTASETTKGGIKVGTNLSMEGEILNAKDTTYSDVTQFISGLMSAEDKKKLDRIEEDANNYVHPNSTVIPGTYKSVTVDSKGHITSGTNPTTLADYGITDGALSSDLITHTNDISNPHKVTKAQVGLSDVENKSSATIRGELTKSNVITALGYTPLDAVLKGSANGIAELDTNGKVPVSQLPSYVDDVIEGYLSGGNFYKESSHSTEIAGESGKIYIDLHTEKTYRWSGTTFSVVSETLALGETASTAYRGDRGKVAYDHSQTAHAPSNAQVNVIETVKVNGTALTPSSKAVNVTVPTKVSQLTNDSGFTTNTGTVTGVKVGSTSYSPSSGIVSLPAYPTSLPASDVYSWAKASSKPSYSYSEISGTPTIPTKFSELTNDLDLISHNVIYMKIGNTSENGYIDMYYGGVKTRVTCNDTLTSGAITVRYPAKGGTLAISSSDARLKDNVKDTTINALETINKIKVRQFDWNDNVENGNDRNTHQDIGFIADELEELDNRLAIGGGEDENGEINIKGVDMFYMLGYVVKAIQELSQENESLKDKIKTLEK